MQALAVVSSPCRSVPRLSDKWADFPLMPVLEHDDEGISKNISEFIDINSSSSHLLAPRSDDTLSRGVAIEMSLADGHHGNTSHDTSCNQDDEDNESDNACPPIETEK